MSRPTLEQIIDQLDELLHMVDAYEGEEDDGGPRLVTHVLADLLGVLEDAGDVPVLIASGPGGKDTRPYRTAEYDSTTKIEAFEPGGPVETFGMDDDDGDELTPAGLAFEGRQPVVVMWR
jgi:hypothetical protein